MIERSCGPCTACCSNARVPELNKPERVRCAHVCEDGCGIYQDRPASCASFRCAWLDGAMWASDRPDLSGVMVEDYGRFLFAMCDGDDWRRMGALDDFVRDGRPVVIGTKMRNAMLLPPGMDPSAVAVMVQEVLNGRC